MFLAFITDFYFGFRGWSRGEADAIFHRFDTRHGKKTGTSILPIGK